MQLLHLVIAAALVAATYGQIPPSFFVVQPGSSDSSPVKTFVAPGQTYAVSVGSNVTLGCQYTDPSWTTYIGKWSITNSILYPMISNGYVLPDFADLISRYPALGLRVSSSAFFSANPVLVYLRLTNVQQHDMGQYGCFSQFSKSTPTANITLVLNQTNVYGVRSVSTDQQMVVAVNSTTSSYSCSVYRSPSVTPDYIMWFDKCKWSGLGQDIGNAARTISCNNNVSIYSASTKTQTTFGLGPIGPTGTEAIITDMYPMPAGTYFGSTFWQRNVVRDWYSLTLSWQTIYGTPVGSPSGWLNQSLGCFAYRNATNAFFRDYMTFVQPGVDLDLDPTLFSCGRHHFVQAQGSVVPLSCTVIEPIYRSGGVFTWEISTPVPSPNGPLTPYSYASQADLNNRGIGKNLLFIAPQSSIVNASLNLQQNQTKIGLNVTVDSASTVNWRYRLVVTYSDSSISRSEFFTISTIISNGTLGAGPQTPPKTGAVKGGAAAVGSSSLLFALVLALALLRSLLIR